MTIEQWLEDGKSDAQRRKLPELANLLEGLSRATAALRAADWNDDAERDSYVSALSQPEPPTA
jgi:hypothetical protein